VRLRLPDFIDNGNMKVAVLPVALGTDCFYPKGYPWYPFPLETEPSPGP